MTPKRRRFVEEYLIDCNATAAARRAEFKHPNTQGPRLLLEVCVQEAIAEAQARLSAAAEVTLQDIRRGLKAEATCHDDDASGSSRVAAWRELAKLGGHYPPDKSEHRFPDGIPSVDFVRVHKAPEPVHARNGRAT